MHPGDYVVCCDEKPSIQAGQRNHTTLAAKPGVTRGQRVEHEYHRRGALCYFAAWDVRRAKLFDRCDTKDGSSNSSRSAVATADRPTVRVEVHACRSPRHKLDRPAVQAA
ncbi:MAG: hypothetical protein ACYDHH_33885 [Solirubrobacteraceae bacterium]